MGRLAVVGGGIAEGDGLGDVIAGGVRVVVGVGGGNAACEGSILGVVVEGIGDGGGGGAVDVGLIEGTQLSRVTTKQKARIWASRVITSQC